MSETIDYAEMLEIPVSTLNVTKKRGKKHRAADDLKERVVESVNERLESPPAGEEAQPAAEARVAEGENIVDYGAPAAAQEKPRARFLEGKVLIAEFIAVCALCATILLTNLFWENSAINTFFRGLVSEETPVAAQDDRTYAELTLGSVVSDDVACTVSDTGELTFTAACSVYAPYTGTVQRVTEENGLYTVEVEHTSSFTSVISGLTYAYVAAGDEAYTTIPVGYSDGASAVSVAMYDAGSLISAYSLDENNDIVWNV